MQGGENISISNRAPQTTNAALWDWLKVGYEVPHGPSYPPSPSDKAFFYNETLGRYAQYDQSVPGWVNLGPGPGFHKGNLPTGTNTIELHDSKSGNFAYLFVVNNPDNPPAPLLMTDQGFLVKKDLAVGGFVNSIQGALWLNYGLVGRPILSSHRASRRCPQRHNIPQDQVYHQTLKRDNSLIIAESEKCGTAAHGLLETLQATTIRYIYSKQMEFHLHTWI